MGGKSISDECNSNPLYQTSEYRVTTGGQSSFSNIVHFVPSKLDLLDLNLEKVLILVDEKLQKSSIAIPAIGTGTANSTNGTLQFGPGMWKWQFFNRFHFHPQRFRFHHFMT